MRPTNAVLLAAALAACDLTATAESDSVCVTQPSTVTIPGAPASGGATVTSVTPFTLDVSAIVPENLNSNGVSAELLAQSIALGSLEGVDLSGIDAAAVTLARPSAPADDVVFAYIRPAGGGATSAVVLTPTRPVDLVDYLEDTSLLIIDRITLSGRAPSSAWTPTARTCASVKVEVDELEAAGL